MPDRITHSPPARRSARPSWPRAVRRAALSPACAARPCCAGGIAPAAAEELLIAPPDLRTQDASLVDEIEAGTFGLAGCVAMLDGRSPFAIEPPNADWERELHGFGWLRHLDGARSLEVETFARELVREWIAGSRRRHPPAWRLDVVGRRVIAWLSHAAPAAGRRSASGPTRPSCAAWTSRLRICTASWQSAPDGYPRLLALIALVKADLCIAGRDRQLDYSVPPLAAELQRQILPDGGHISRNPATLIELMLDLLPLRQCFGARSIKPEPALLAAIARMAPMLRTLAAGRRPAGALQRRRLHGARCAGHRARLRRQSADLACHRPAVGIPAHCARLRP